MRIDGDACTQVSGRHARHIVRRGVTLDDRCAFRAAHVTSCLSPNLGRPPLPRTCWCRRACLGSEDDSDEAEEVPLRECSGTPAPREAPGHTRLYPPGLSVSFRGSVFLLFDQKLWCCGHFWSPGLIHLPFDTSYVDRLAYMEVTRDVK